MNILYSCADRLYMLYTVWFMLEGKEDGKKERKKKNTEVKIFTFDFLEYDKD